MKKQAVFWLALMLCAALLAGCAAEPQKPIVIPQKEQTAPVDTEEPKETEAPAEQEQEQPAEPAPEEAPEPEPAPEEIPEPEPEPVPEPEPEPQPEPEPEPAPEPEPQSYTVRLSALIPIFDQPTYDGCYVQCVGEDGVYTIVEEKTDEEGSLWGKLKSGIGWIDLTALEQPTPVLAALMDERILEQPHHIAIVDNSEYMVYLVFAATETLTDVRLTMLQPAQIDYVEESTLHTIPEMTPEKPLVAEVVFYGDFTTYGLTFTDESGTERYFALYISGRNGAPVLQEFEP